MVLAFALLTLAACLAALVTTWRLCMARRKVLALASARSVAERSELYCPRTGLANRRRALDWLAAELAAGMLPAVIVIALDPKHHGPAELETQALPVAARLAKLAGATSLAGRLRQAEYLLALPGGCDTAGLIARAQAVHDALAPLLGEDPGLHIGAALACPGDSGEELVARAVAAMGRATDIDGPSIGVEGPESESTRCNRAAEADALAAAIAGGRIEPFFQPLVELGSGRVLGFEVLARWRDEDGHLRLPAEFVPLAEQSGLVGEMFFALLRRAATEVRGWPPEWSFALNLSPVQFADRDLAERTVRTLLAAGVMPGRLEVEISERALEHDFEGARRTIEALRRHGVRIALDNLGNGHLPMRELAGLDFDRLKIDGRILDGNAGEDRHVAFGLMVSAAHHLGIPVVAQGIETRDGASRAQAQGAAIGQGYLFGRPDPHTECFRLEGALARGIEDAA